MHPPLNPPLAMEPNECSINKQKTISDSNEIRKIVNELAGNKTKFWADPTELITEDGKILASSDDFAESLNKHIVYIGPKMAESMSPVDPEHTLTPFAKSCTNIKNAVYYLRNYQHYRLYFCYKKHYIKECRSKIS